MSTRAKAKPDDETPETPSEQPAEAEQQEQQLCGKPHFLPALTHVTCTQPAPDPDLPPGTPDHQHQHQDGDALYIW
ncbi:hypothetical protein [Streptomyces sp. NPDC005732]|uniref:hypothetical protein n=1 Tax=Streptomyces sp. NPDC005732 TaxID=3157057 RepID=UPI0033D14786